MGTLTDIAGAGRTVDVRGTSVDVPGIGAAGIALLIGRYKAIADMLEEKGEDGKPPSLSPDVLMRQAPEAIAAIIAAGTGAPGDKDAEAVAARLSAPDQLRLLDAILLETFPDGLGEFMAQVQVVTSRLGLSNSQQPSNT